VRNVGKEEKEKPHFGAKSERLLHQLIWKAGIPVADLLSYNQTKRRQFSKKKKKCSEKAPRSIEREKRQKNKQGELGLKAEEK